MTTKEQSNIRYIVYCSVFEKVCEDAFETREKADDFRTYVLANGDPRITKENLHVILIEVPN